MTRLVKVLGIIMLMGLLTSAKNHSPSWVVKLQDSYSNTSEFVMYWYDSQTMENYECVYGIDQEMIISKMWMETHGGRAGAGTRGCLFGIKGKGVKGFDAKEKNMSNKGKVEYRSYEAAWEAISDFCKLIKKPLYAERFKAWKKKNYDMPDWYNYNLALQVHPDIDKSRLSYASCGCEANKKTKKISKRCYEKRKAHAMKNNKWILNNLR